MAFYGPTLSGVGINNGGFFQAPGAVYTTVANGVAPYQVSYATAPAAQAVGVNYSAAAPVAQAATVGYAAAPVAQVAPVSFPAYGGYAQYQTYPVGYVGGGYSSLAGYGAPRANYYQQASYSTSLSGDALAYGAGGFAAGSATAAAAAAAPAASFQQRPAQFTGPVLSGLQPASSYGGVSGGIEQYGVNLAPQIEAAYEAAALHRRQPVVRRQVIQVPGTPGQVKQIVRRVPTPIPDVIERVFVVKPQRDVINLVIERPTTPPPQIKNRTIVSKPRKPVIHSHVVRVAPRIGYQQAQIQYTAPAAPVATAQVAAPAPAAVSVGAPVYAYDAGYAAYGGYPVAAAGGYPVAAAGGYPVAAAGAYPVAAAGAYPAAYAGYSYSSSFDSVYGGAAAAGGYPAAAYPQYGGYSTGFAANYGLPAYGGAVSYAQPYYYAQPYATAAGNAAFPTSSQAAYSGVYTAQPAAAFATAQPATGAFATQAAYPSVVLQNPAGNAYYGYGYPTANYTVPQRV